MAEDSLMLKKAIATIEALQDVFAGASVGDFSRPVQVPETEDICTPILVGVEVMRQVIVDQVAELQAANAVLAQKVERASLTRPLVRSIIRQLIDGGSVPSSVLRGIGEGLAADVSADGLGAFARSFEDMGLGHMRFEGDAGADGRFAFTATDLLERRDGARMTTCFLATGYVVGAVARASGSGRIVGSEVSCQSRGDAECRFVVQATTQPRALRSPQA